VCMGVVVGEVMHAAVRVRVRSVSVSGGSAGRGGDEGGEEEEVAASREQSGRARTPHVAGS
jgi:hypothetical protein